MTTDSYFLALHGLVVKKAAGPEAVAELLGDEVDTVSAAIEEAVSDGRAAGAKGTYMVAPAGRTWLDEQYPQRYKALRADSASSDAYDRFEVINRELLELFTDWQTVSVGGEQVPNDHNDEQYDNAIIDRLGDLHERALPVLEDLAKLEPRLSRYLERLDAADDRILAGEIEYVSGVRLDSYHTVWFELHEDLLRMLGRTREE